MEAPLQRPFGMEGEAEVSLTQSGTNYKFYCFAALTAQTNWHWHSLLSFLSDKFCVQGGPTGFNTGNCAV